MQRKSTIFLYANGQLRNMIEKIQNEGTKKKKTKDVSDD